VIPSSKLTSNQSQPQSSPSSSPQQPALLLGCIPADDPGASRTLSRVRAREYCLPPLRYKVGAFHHHYRFRAMSRVHFRSGLPPSPVYLAGPVCRTPPRLVTTAAGRLCPVAHRSERIPCAYKAQTLTLPALRWRACELGRKPSAIVLHADYHSLSPSIT